VAVKAKQPCECFITCRVCCSAYHKLILMQSACRSACVEMSRCGPISALVCCLSQLTTTFPLAQVQAHTFELEEDTTSYGDYVKGGIVTEHKEHKTLDFKPLAQALDDPGEFLLSDFAKMERPGILHLGFQALNDFQVCGICFEVKSELSAILGAGSRHVHLFRTCSPVNSSSNVTAGLYHLRHLNSLSISRDSLSISGDNPIALYAKQQE